MRRLFVQLAAVTALTLGLAACGDSDGGGGDPEASPTSPATVAGPTGPVAGADTPEGQAFCDEAISTVSAAFDQAVQAYDEFFETEAGTDEWLMAFGALNVATTRAAQAARDMADVAPTPELAAVFNTIADQIDIQANGSTEVQLHAESAPQLLAQLNAACGRASA
jgi:hypothetical protein